VQILALDNGTPVGTGRMLADGHIGRIAVLMDYRKTGIGKQIVSCLIKHARNNNLDRVFLGAQISAVPFYEKLGFCRSGEDYMEANILHTPMALGL
jgi:predicted GNAT family N-acyltransferase